MAGDCGALLRLGAALLRRGLGGLGLPAGLQRAAVPAFRAGRVLEQCPRREILQMESYIIIYTHLLLYIYSYYYYYYL